MRKSKGIRPGKLNNKSNLGIEETLQFYFDFFFFLLMKIKNIEKVVLQLAEYSKIFYLFVINENQNVIRERIYILFIHKE
jgi:hypothetical protein